MSIDLGGGACLWQPPEYDVPSELDFHKTIIAGFPSGDKRMIFGQMEALTGWRKFCVGTMMLISNVLCVVQTWLTFYSSVYIHLSTSFHLYELVLHTFSAAKDEWDFEFLGDSNHPFIKANYPHHEGMLVPCSYLMSCV